MTIECLSPSLRRWALSSHQDPETNGGVRANAPTTPHAAAVIHLVRRNAKGVVQTPEMELIHRVDGTSGSAIEVEVRWSQTLANLAEDWGNHTVAVAAHWLDRKGRDIQWDGPRGLHPIDLRRLPDAPQTRWLRLDERPEGAAAVSVELVAEGLQWGSAVGIRALLLLLDGPSPTLPARHDHPIRRASAEQAAITPEMRVVKIISSDDGVAVDVEVRWSEELSAVAATWREHPVVVEAHLLDAGRVPVYESGARSLGFDLHWLPLGPQTRRIHLGALSPDVYGLALDLVADGFQHGPDAGIDTLQVPFGQLTAAPLVRPVNRGHGPGAPSESPDKTREWLAAAFPEDANPDEMAAYVGADLARFLMSVQLMGDDPGAILEVGSNPYFISRLIRSRFPASPLTMTNYFGFPGETITQKVVDDTGTAVAVFTSALVDTETEPLPYGDASFDTVLLCEVIEHLIQDPVYQLAEIARVLRPGGRLILTTPNVARANNRLRLAQREGIYDPYSQYGPHGRHNREYTASELFELASGTGFTPINYLTRPVHTVPDPDEAWFRGDGDDGAGDYHFLVAERRGAVRRDRPNWLYR